MRIISRTGLLVGLAFAGALALASAAQAGSAHVNARDNEFVPQEIRIDPGGRVVWENVGFAGEGHNVRADNGSFDSGRIARGEEFTHPFRKEGYYFYHCKFHGDSRSGMWGVVVVGDPAPPGGRRPRLVVPDEFPTIQKAVDKARPGSTVVVKPGKYREEVDVRVPDLVIKGVDRFRTILNGGDVRETGITVEGFGEVSIKNLTIRNFTESGIYLNDATGYTVSQVDLIKNQTYGVHAVDSYDGVIKSSFGWGSGDSAFRIANCSSCSTLVDSIQGLQSYIGLTVENALGVVVRDSRFARNGTGIVSMTSPDAPGSPNRGVHILGNTVTNNYNSTIPEAGVSTQHGLPFGTGIWLAGASNNVVEDNDIEDTSSDNSHLGYGILVTRTFDSVSPAMSNRVVNNRVDSSGVFDLAWDGYGDDDCFEGNVVTGIAGPVDLQEAYACSMRPFTGTPFTEVADAVTAALLYDPLREQTEPPEPKRPKCQRC